MKTGTKNLDSDRIISLYNEALLSITEIALKLNTSETTIWRKLMSAGISCNHTTGYDLDIPQIISLYVNQKLSCGEIAKQLGVHLKTINKRLRKLGLIRSRSEAAKLSYENGKSPAYKTGQGNPGWKGGKHLDHKGYITVLVRRLNRSLYVPEHILVWEKTHNCPVPKGYVIHHLNGIKIDNRPENLSCLPKKKHDELIPEMAKKIRMLEIENEQLREALKDSQMILNFGEN